MKQFVISLLVFYSLSAVSAEEPSSAQRLQDKMSQLTTFSAAFSQNTIDADGYLLDEIEGKMLFSRPNHLRWEASVPYSQLMVADGESIFLYDPDLEQVTVRRWSNDPSENPAVIFLSGSDLDADFIVSSDDETYELIPRAENTTIFSLTVEFDDDVPTAMTIEDALGQKTQIEFQSPEIGIELDAEIFRFDIPEGADVITDG